MQNQEEQMKKTGEKEEKIKGFHDKTEKVLF